MSSDINDMLDQLTDSSGWPSIWFSVANQSWNSLVIVPAHVDLLVHPVARALVEAARLYDERPIRLIDAEDASPRQAREITGLLREYADQGQRCIIAVRSPLVSHPATPIARACDAAVLLIPIGETSMRTARQTIAAVGHENFLGAFTISPVPDLRPVQRERDEPIRIQPELDTPLLIEPERDEPLLIEPELANERSRVPHQLTKDTVDVE